jgi:phosphoribosylglycinamide formyltransferase 1
MASIIRLAIFASGGGSNALKIIEHFKDHDNIKIALVVCNKSTAGVIKIAEDRQIPVQIIDKTMFTNELEFISIIRKFNIHNIVLAGFLWKIPSYLIKAFSNKIINIHPSLLPKYGGKGMYGHYVHEAVKANNEIESGITIHLVDEIYDNGKILFQAKCAVDPLDSAETIAANVLKLEHFHYPRVIEAWLSGDLKQ